MINPPRLHIIYSVIRCPCKQKQKALHIIRRGILQGDAFCVKLFTLCLKRIAWYVRGTEGYSLSHAMNTKITHCLCVDDLKTYLKGSVNPQSTSREESSRIPKITSLQAVAKYQYKEKKTITNFLLSYRMSNN